MHFRCSPTLFQPCPATDVRLLLVVVVFVVSVAVEEEVVAVDVDEKVLVVLNFKAVQSRSLEFIPGETAEVTTCC